MRARCSLSKLHYPSGAAITYAPDSAGRLLSAVDSANSINYATGATYQADGQMTGFISGNTGTFAGITNAFSYSRRLQPINMSANAPSQTVFSIGYDFHVGNGSSGTDNGNVYNIYNYRDRTRDQSFSYDQLNRLLSAQNAGTNCAANTVNGKTEYWGNNYGYDAWGNLLTKSVSKCSAEGMSLWTDGHNWAHAVSGTDYQYDAAGNMTLNATAPATTYSYDPENRITGAAGFTYTYDADGNRARKSNGTGAANGTLYWYMTPGIVGESDLAGTMKSEYVFFNGERVARRDLVAPTGVFYYFSDHLKTASVITDSAGVIKSDSDYYPWGGELQFVNADSNHYKFTGKERDTETSLDYFGARYYASGLGRWISADWSPKQVPVPYAQFNDPQTLNLYAYVRGLPTTFADSDGHGFWDKLKNLFSKAECWCEGKEAEARIEQRKRDEEAWSQSVGEYFKTANGQVTLAAVSSLVATTVVSAVDAAVEDAPSEPATAEPAATNENYVNLADAKATKHILTGDGNGSGGHRPGLGIPGKTEFPKGWSDAKIMHVISDVATDPKSTVSVQGKTTIVQGAREGVDVKVIIRDNRIVTGYPTNLPKNP